MNPRTQKAEYVLILRELETGPATADDLAAAIGIHKRNVREYLKLMKGQIHIKSFERSRRGPPVPVYALGRKPNCRRPKPLSGATIAAQYRARKKEHSWTTLNKCF